MTIEQSLSSVKAMALCLPGDGGMDVFVRNRDLRYGVRCVHLQERQASWDQHHRHGPISLMALISRHPKLASCVVMLTSDM